jgi:NTP pyrophosphatase (non-canonical NTP hydrolase)
MGCCQSHAANADLTFNEYQQKALSTAIYPKEFALQYTSMGLAGEIGEVLGKLAKVYRDKNGELDFETKMAVLSEIGDCEWFLAALTHELGFTLGEVAQMNLTKLASRKARGTLSGSGDQR